MQGVRPSYLNAIGVGFGAGDMVNGDVVHAFFFDKIDQVKARNIIESRASVERTQHGPELGRSFGLREGCRVRKCP